VKSNNQYKERKSCAVTRRVINEINKFHGRVIGQSLEKSGEKAQSSAESGVVLAKAKKRRARVTIEEAKA
jgi:hypothetical protein